MISLIFTYVIEISQILETHRPGMGWKKKFNYKTASTTPYKRCSFSFLTLENEKEKKYLLIGFSSIWCLLYKLGPKKEMNLTTWNLGKKKLQLINLNFTPLAALWNPNL